MGANEPGGPAGGFLMDDTNYRQAKRKLKTGKGFDIAFARNILVHAALVIFLSIISAGAVCAQSEGGALNILFSNGDNSAGSLKTYEYNYPYGFKISRDGSLYLSNTPKNSILQFDFMGRLVKSYSSRDHLFDCAGDLAFDNDGMLYFASLKTMQIIKVDMLSNELQRFGGRSTAEAGLMSIYQIEAAFGKKIFAQDIVSSKINAYSSTGAFIKKIDCNVAGFAITQKGGLLYFNYDRYSGYSLFLADINEKTSRRVFCAGLAAVESVEFIGADHKGNIYISASVSHRDPFSEREIIVYNANGIYLNNYRVKKSLITRQFFVFGDGSLYSAETDATAANPLPAKISIKKY